MKIALFAKPQSGHSAEEVSKLLGALEASSLDYSVNSAFAAILPQLCGITVNKSRQYDSLNDGSDIAMMICYGGDGTFLEGVREVNGCGLPILGINSGRLGFLANVPKEGIENAFAGIAAGEYSIEERTMLHVESRCLPEKESMFAFNEFTIHRGAGAMIAVELFVDGEMVGRYWGDGVILSTPSGSTAYSLSAGGPVVAPGCECLLISPIAPHNLTMRPVVIPDSSTVELKVSSRGDTLYASLDNKNYPTSGAPSFRVTKSGRSAKLVRLKNISFYDTLRNKLMWGLDRRDDQK